MAVNVVRDASLFLGGRNLSGDLNAVALNYSAEVLDATRLGDDTRRRVGGLKGVTCAAEGFVDPATSEGYLFNRIGAANEPVTVGKDGSAAGDGAYLFKAVAAAYNPGGAVGELYKFSFDAEAAESPLVNGTILHNVTGETANGSSTGLQLGAVASGEQLFAALHVLSVSAGDSIDVVLESSVDNTFSAPTTRATFTTASAQGGEWVTPVDGPITDTWWRITWTFTGASPSFDFVASMGIL